jgi:uncharacterized protein YjiS (DUF1127 family)
MLSAGPWHLPVSRQTGKRAMASVPHFETLVRYLVAIRSVHREIRTARLVEVLPDHLLKDIGWPDRDRLRSHLRRPVA